MKTKFAFYHAICTLFACIYSGNVLLLPQLETQETMKMKKIILISIVAILALGGMNHAQAQVMKVADLEKYAKERYGDKWLDAAKNIATGLTLVKNESLTYQQVTEAPDGGEQPENTNAPSPTPEPNQMTGNNWKVEEIGSIKAEYIALMKEYLAGGKPDLAPLKNPLNKPEYWFDNAGKFEGGWLGTFSSYLYLSNEADDEWDHYLCLHHVSSIPLETYRAAVDRIIEYRKQYWNMDSVRTDSEEENFGIAPIECFCGENWFVLPDWEVEMNRQGHTIWRTDDGEHYYEFGEKNGELGIYEKIVLDALLSEIKRLYLHLLSQI